MSVRKDEIPQQSSAPLEGSLQQKLCLPGGFLTTGPARKPSELLLEEKQKKIAVPPPRTLSVSANLALSVEKMHLNSVKNAAPGREADRITPSPEMQQEPAAPEGPQRRRWLLVPTDGTQSLKLFFSDFAAIFSL
ncbi:PREDICTED: uncharacterized protein LOC108635411 isoform X4 [Capra hircus]|uniref:uncharacterized protein LOC108635411 isoform X4 n=1 Tax=Capra hircus TaxID=9925 RepID=UPI000847485C|nr:PREDICTED: uncharacterized protein LOC108635411 isoform X4 [Capra hircus]